MWAWPLASRCSEHVEEDSPMVHRRRGDHFQCGFVSIYFLVADTANRTTCASGH